MDFIFMVVAIWYGIWEGLIEPSLPYYSFQAEDVLQLGFGLVCCIGAYMFYTRANTDDASQIEVAIRSIKLARERPSWSSRQTTNTSPGLSAAKARKRPGR